jgi:TonB family protein
MGEPVFTCERCGFSGSAGEGGCPRCATAEPFRVPALAAPGGPDRFEGSEIQPGGAPPAGGYVDLDLGEDGDPAPAPAPARAAAPPPRRRTGERTAPSFAAVAPQPHTPKSAVPVLAAVGLGCLALIAVGAFFAGRAGTAPAEAAAAAPAAPPAAAPASAAAAAAVAAAEQPGAPARAAEPASAPAAQPSAQPAAPAAHEPVAAPPPKAPAPRQAPRPPAAEPRRASVAAAEPRPPVVVASLPAREPVETRPLAAPPPVAAPTAQAVPLPPPPAPIEEAPRYPTEGFRRPRLVEPGCVQRSIRLPRDATARLSGPVTVKFAVGTAGEVGLFQVLGDVGDPRVAQALSDAVRGCRFVPGADAQGTPTRLWVTMPIRFE